jgi:uncharacterized protein YsxB (DUF464 family)
MTTVTLLLTQEQFCGFACEGHADYAESGSDIVCAAVSALTLTCVNALESVAGIAPKVKRRPKDAYLQVLLPEDITQEQRHDSQVLLRFLQQGIGDLAEQYPKHVHLSIQEWRKPT